MHDELIRNLDEASPATRMAARAALVAAGETAVPALLAALDAAGPDGRREAALALGELKARAAVPALVTLVEKEPYPLASWAAHALGLIGDAQATPVLVTKLADEELRQAAASALALLGDQLAVPALHQALAPLFDRIDLGSYLGRYWIARALVRLDDRSATGLRALEEVIDRDFGPSDQQSWGSFRDDAVDLLIAARGAEADAFLRPILKRERETLQLRYHIARHYWLKGETGDALHAILQRMARHPLYPAYAAEARDLLATAH